MPLKHEEANMFEPLDEYADIQVTVSRLQASQEQIEEIKQWVRDRLRSTLFELDHSVSLKLKHGAVYEITFRCDEPNRFKDEQLAKKLYEMQIVGWEINSEFVKGNRKKV